MSPTPAPPSRRVVDKSGERSERSAAVGGAEWIGRLEPVVYPAIRIIVAFCFSLHGMQKLFGLFGKDAVPLFSQMGLGGVIELVAGILMMLGLFTRAAAFVASGQMAVAYFQFHVASSGTLFPIQNGGDDTMLYCLWFLFVFVHGPGPWSLDNRIFPRRAP